MQKILCSFKQIDWEAAPDERLHGLLIFFERKSINRISLELILLSVAFYLPKEHKF